MRTEDFDYHLPPELIAAIPAERRDSARLLVLDRKTGRIADRIFSDLPNLLRPGDCLVLNDSRVIPARLLGTRESGGQSEVLLIHEEHPGLWRAMVRPGRKLSAGKRIIINAPNGESVASVIIESELPEGERLVRVESSLPLLQLLEQHGQMPLPPYILAARKERGLGEQPAKDRERYQTVYAQAGASVAAPTAGLHFTPELLAALAVKDIEVRRVRLDVGPGTFAPIKVEDPTRHLMHSECFAVTEPNAEAIEAARRDPDRRIVAVGTTVTRVLETLMLRDRCIGPGEGTTDLLILPGHRFQAVDALITNFHLPRSTLLMLVSAFAGRERILLAYRHAVQCGYRFYSYGDAMLIQ